ncbi:transcriptional regulator, LysR family [Streptosporangium subroseum]|uniref:Transcriptional regulator, LysR family n=1 Tax=Streptosporangium subroseum TaxID=106412 RepID=A0A239NMR2_9ACTN|nr:LysR substrate-binding domain-containing protein [Streptosporangium subroseum]SNT56187.1 transcriptional regulator, LysR family [Streptosporangium subroseum]
MTHPELRQLRYFLAVAEELSFTRAAERLLIAQQSLSQQITALERRLGVRLFDRDSRGTRLTAVGGVFVSEARAVLERADQALAVLQRARRGEVGDLRLAFLTTVANHLLPPIVRALREQLADVRITTESTTIAALVEGVTGGRYDAAFTRPPLVDGLASRTLANEPVCAVLPEDHALAHRTELDLRDLAGERWVLTPPSSWEPWHRTYNDHFHQAGFIPDVVHTDANPQNLLGLVAAGVGITRLVRSSQSLRRTGVVFIPFADAYAPTDVIWLPRNDNPALPRLLEIVTDLAATRDLTQSG